MEILDISLMCLFFTHSTILTHIFFTFIFLLYEQMYHTKKMTIISFINWLLLLKLLVIHFFQLHKYYFYSCFTHYINFFLNFNMNRFFLPFILFIVLINNHDLLNGHFSYFEPFHNPL